MEKEKDGVWRTIRGRRIFIASGESLGQAMKKSGKFKDFKRSEIKDTKDILSRNDKVANTIRKHKGQPNKVGDTSYKEGLKKGWFPSKDNQAKKNRINENGKTYWPGDTRVERYSGKYSETDRRELDHEELQKKLADYKAKKQSNNKIDSAKDIDSELRAKEDKYLSSYKPSEKQAKDIKKLHDKLKTQAEKEGYDTSKTNWRDDLQSNNKVDKEYHFAGEELYSDDPHRYDDTIKSAQARKEKFKADDNFKKEKHIGWGSYNKDGVPVYDNDIDYKGDFGWANLKTLSDDDLTKALNIQSEEYHKANAESVGDRRTRNGRMNKIFKDAKVGKYEQGMKKINEEMQNRNMPRYNIYDKKNPNNILVSSPTKEMADKQIQDMYKTDISLQKEYGWKELPKYDYRVGKVDENLNEIKETIKRYKQRKGK